MQTFNANRRPGSRQRKRRRAVALLLALGVLSILSIAAIAYVTIVRIDRSAVLTHGRRANFERQADALIGEIQAVLAADLFGNKIVTPGVPLEIAGQRVWPRMFEDGEFTDMPSVDLTTFSASMPTGQLQLTRPDDAWLSPVDPEWDPVNVDLTSLWPQITNLRSSYRWVSSGVNGTWVRDDGRYVDLAQWFINSVPTGSGYYADPSIDLLDWNDVTLPGRIGPEYATAESTGGLINELRIFDSQMHELNPLDVSPAIRPSDERYLVDTDGDLRPDARWTQLESLGDVGGLIWVAAVRIVDASAFVNINTAIEFGSPSGVNNYSKVGDGRTPSDVDLKRLLAESANTNAFDPPSFIDRLLGSEISFNNHLQDGLGLNNIILDIRVNHPGEYSGLDVLTQLWNVNNSLTRVQRQAFYEFFGQSVLQPRSNRGTGYPNRDLVDLLAFSGTNHYTILSKVEQYIDGTESLGYLPQPSDPEPNAVGPLRAKEKPAASRNLLRPGQPRDEAEPNPQQLRDSRRRLLTTISGMGHYSPVPVLNRDPSMGAMQPAERIRVDDTFSDSDIPAAFESFIWALAPLMTNQPLAREFAGADGSPGINVDPATGAADPDDFCAVDTYSTSDTDAYHYGGGATGPARRLYGASGRGMFAAVTAASLAVNLRDAIDRPPAIDQPDPPTVTRLYNDVTASEIAGEAPPLTRRLRQGDIPQAALNNPEYIPSATEPYVIVGAERQPFLREASAISVFREDPDGSPNGVIGDDLNTDFLGVVIAIQLENPWPDQLVLDNYRVVIPEVAQVLRDSDPMFSEVSLTFAGMPPLAGGLRQTYYWVSSANSQPVDWDEIVDEMVPTLLPNAPGAGTVQVLPAIDLINFRHMLETPSRRPILLTWFNSTGQHLVLDRMNLPLASDFFPPAPSSGGFGGFTVASDIATNIGFALTSDDTGAVYYNQLGYDTENDLRWGNTSNQSGQLMVTASLTRPGALATDPDTGTGLGGFPAWTIEFAPEGAAPGRNHYHIRREMQSWLVPEQGTDPPTTSIDAPRDLIDPSATPGYFYSFPDDHTDLNYGDKRADNPTRHTSNSQFTPNPRPVNPLELPAFQIFMPNGPLHNVSEILQLPIYAHSYRQSNLTLPPDEDLLNLANWRTAGEKRGLSLKYDFTASLGNTTTPSNPYLGTLDPTRFIIGQMLEPIAIPGLPSSMAIPLALRAPDCFEALPILGNLKQGTININTAPDPVLRTLPFIDPEFAMEDVSGAGLLSNTQLLTFGATRIDLMKNFRTNPDAGFVQLSDGSSTTAYPGYRVPIPAILPPGSPLIRGFATPAELAVLGIWQTTTGGIAGMTGSPLPAATAGTSSQPHTFLALGADGVDNNLTPLQVESRISGFVGGYNPVDDAEERMAIYRANSNIAAARSDVYFAWIVIRGYNPAAIERIRIPTVSAGAPSVTDALQAMDDPDSNFRPEYETRMLVVIDRSQTESGSPLRRPTDRPRIILRSQLPAVWP